VIRPRLIALVALALSCHSATPPSAPTRPTFFTAQLADTRFRVADHFLASIEMQISGEPFAQLLGRNLAGYDRFNKIPNLYVDPATGAQTIDPMSFSMAIESYEYSKQPMNNTSFESGAGLSLAFGPLVNPTQAGGDAAFVLLRDRLQHLAEQSGTGGAPGTNWVIAPAPTNNPFNVYGWPGYWPVFAEFKSFDPAISPTGGATRGCSFVGGYAAMVQGIQFVGDYECGYNSLNLPSRETQVEKVLEPAALGFAMWKQGLWVINYWQSVHDSAGNVITQVADADVPSIGQPNNTAVGQYPDPNDPTGRTLLSGAPGLYLGDIAIEGWQGLTMLDEMDNKSALTLRALLTSDGTELGGFASTKDALAYDYTSPLRYWPAAIAVRESNTDGPAAGTSWKNFPQPIAFTIQNASSRLRGLAALAGGYSELFALTDFNNADVGAQPSSRATFDGDPLAADDQLPDGEETPHDRALANIKVAVIDIDRLHFDLPHLALVDEAKLVGGKIVRGSVVSTVDAAYTIVALRTAYRSIMSSLTLYSNDTPDTQGGTSALDGAPLAGAPAPLPTRMIQLIRVEANFILSRLMAPDGSVANSFDLDKNAPDPAATTVESEASAIRGLLEAYLATSDVKYRDGAERLYADFEQRFWMANVRAFRTTAGVSDTMVWTPVAFGTVQGALRQYWKLVARRPGKERVAAELLERVQRMNKLVANGWDDANADNRVQYPDECLGAGLQMAERMLTGELSHLQDAGDRDHDCVFEIAQAKLPSALASRVVLQRRKAP
jgi:hypothetical protein